MELAMSINSISGNMATYQLPQLQTVGSLNKSVTGTPAKKEPLAIQAAQSGAVDTTAKITQETRQAPVASTVLDNKPNNVVISYNQHGQVRTKFMDSTNNVIYQIPTELAAKLADQMLAGTATSIKG
jgi:uncharacterized FlaG/YvyC family protein